MKELIEQARAYADKDDYFTTRNLLRLLCNELEKAMQAKVSLEFDLWLNTKGILVFLEGNDEPIANVSLKKLIEQELKTYRLLDGSIPNYHQEDLENMIKLFTDCKNQLEKELKNVK